MAGSANYRERMPQCAAFVDDIRAHLGAPVRIVAEEGGEHIRYTAPEVRGLRVRSGGWREVSPGSEFTRGMRLR